LIEEKKSTKIWRLKKCW